MFATVNMAMSQGRPTRLTSNASAKRRLVAVAHRGILAMLVCAVPALYEEHLPRRRSLRSGRMLDCCELYLQQQMDETRGLHT